MLICDSACYCYLKISRHKFLKASKLSWCQLCFNTRIPRSLHLKQKDDFWNRYSQTFQKQDFFPVILYCKQTVYKQLALEAQFVKQPLRLNYLQKVTI